MTSEQIAATIKQRRLQLLVHSCIYYEFNQSVVDDATWAKWALELERLQAAYPAIADKVGWAAEFKDLITAQDIICRCRINGLSARLYSY